MADNHTANRAEEEGTINHYSVQIADIQQWTIDDVKINEALLDKAYTNYRQHHSAVAPDPETDQFETHLNKGTKVRTTYARVKATMAARSRELNPAGALGAVAIPQPPPIFRYEAPREPRVGVFDGSPDGWLNFRDIFKAEIIDNEDLAEVVKLRHLQEACIGRAAEVLGPWSRTDGNFELAWQMLTDRFDDTYSMQQALIKRIYELKPLQTETFECLSNVVNVVQGALRQLKSMKLQTEHWDPLVIFLLSKRLPPATMDTWEQNRIAGVPSTLDKMMTHVQARARGRIYSDNPAPDKFQKGNHQPQGSNNNRSHNNRASFGFKRPENAIYPFNSQSNEKASPANASVPSRQGDNAPTCCLCNQSHPLYRCPKFLDVPLNKKIELVDQLGICRNCLSNHPKGQCKFSACPRCPGEHHNSLLCPKKFGASVNLVQTNKPNKRAKKRSAQQADLA